MVQRAGRDRPAGGLRTMIASTGEAMDSTYLGMNQALRYGVYPADPTRHKLGLLRNAHSRYTMPHPLPARSRGSGTDRADGASMVGHGSGRRDPVRLRFWSWDG